jgi:hypothetical protein
MERESSIVKLKNVSNFILQMSKGENKTARQSKRSLKMEALFKGATDIDLAARSAIGRMVIISLIHPPEEAFEECCRLMVLCKLAHKQYIDQWALFKEDGKKTAKHHWCYQFSLKRSQFVQRLKWSLTQPSHHFTERALVDTWHGIRSCNNYLPVTVFGQSICGIVSVYVSS